VRSIYRPASSATALTRPTGRRLGLWGTVTLSAAAMLAVAACSSSSSSSSGASTSSSGASSSGTYDIGFTSGLTGQFGAVGQGVRNGAEAYFNQVNASGGVNGHKINFTALDDALDPNRGVANMIQLVTQDHDIAVIGFHDSVVADAVAPYAAQYKVPLLVATVDSSLVSPVLPYVYAITCQTADYAAAEVSEAKNLMASHSGTIKVGIITTSDSTALQEWSNDVNAMSKSLGWDVVASEISPQDAINAAPALAKIIAAKPDVLIMALGTDPFLLSAMKQIQQAGASFPVVEYDAPAWTTLQSIGSHQLYYVSAIAYATSASTPQFVTDAAAAKVDPNAIYVSRGYLEAEAVTAALKICGWPCTGAQLDAALNQVNISTGGLISGGLRYSATNHEAVHSMAAFQWYSGATAPVKVSGNLTAGTSLSS
jgi:branched-chain amino acid transport system substrate-binding protein